MAEQDPSDNPIWDPPADCAIVSLGMRLRSASDGNAEADMQIRPVHLNQVGVVQGGIVGAFSDAVAGWATYSAMGPGQTFATIQMQTYMLRSARLGQVLRARARTVHQGRLIAVVEVAVTDRDEPAQRPVAHFTCTQAIATVEN